MALASDTRSYLPPKPLMELGRVWRTEPVRTTRIQGLEGLEGLESQVGKRQAQIVNPVLNLNV